MPNLKERTDRPEGCQNPHSPTDRQFLRMPGCCSHSFIWRFASSSAWLRQATGTTARSRSSSFAPGESPFPQGRQAQTPAQRQSLPRCRVADPSPRTTGLVSSSDPRRFSAGTASSSDESDLPAQDNRPPTARSGDLRARDPHGKREPSMGLHQDPGRAPKARHPCGSDHHQENPSQRRTRTRAEKIGSELVRVPSCPDRRHLACDFFTVETAFLKTLYVLFFIEIGSLRLRVTPSTRNPDGAFVTQGTESLFRAG